MAATGTLGEDLDAEGRDAAELLLRRLADDEFVLAERYTEWQVLAPTLESDLALSNIAQDELGHARLWYDLLMEFGYEEADLVFERGHDGWRHATLVELPFETGDWADAVVRSYLYDVAEDIRLGALEDSSADRIASRVEKIRGEETYHREHAERWLERLAETGESRERLQASLERLYPHALALFAPADEEREARIDDLGLRTRTLSEMRAEWTATVEEFLASLDLRVPEDADLPAATGRDGTHTDAWPALYDDVTRTYHELGRESADRIMGDPDDG